jgi:putative transcriptional regulator
LVARKDNLLLIIKVLKNVDSLNSVVSRELRILAKFLDGMAILIGNKSCSSELKDGILYKRRGIPIITNKTFDEYILEEIFPSILASSGGFRLIIDGEKMKKLREESGISVGYLSRIVGVSRRTIRMYEGGMGASVKSVAKLEEFFGEKIAKPPNLSFESIEKYEINFEGFQGEIFLKLKEVGCSIIPTSRSPFNAISKALNELILIGIGIGKELSKRVGVVSNISRVMEKHSVFFVEKSMKDNIEGTPLIEKRELEEISDPEKIMELILEREK